MILAFEELEQRHVYAGVPNWFDVDYRITNILLPSVNRYSINPVIELCPLMELDNYISNICPLECNFNYRRHIFENVKTTNNILEKVEVDLLEPIEVEI